MVEVKKTGSKLSLTFITHLYKHNTQTLVKNYKITSLLGFNIYKNNYKYYSDDLIMSGLRVGKVTYKYTYYYLLSEPVHNINNK